MDRKAEIRSLEKRQRSLQAKIRFRKDRIADDQAEVKHTEAELEDVVDRWLKLLAEEQGDDDA